MSSLQDFYSAPISANRSITPESYLILHNTPISRTGTYIYRAHELKPSGIAEVDSLPPNAPVQVYRDPATVFAPEAMTSFAGKAITRDHPREFLNVENDGQFRKGFVTNVRRGTLPDGEQALVADLIITCPLLKQSIQVGELAEVSCGYRYSLAKSGGRLVQKNIIGNHVALVSSARGGQFLRVLDSSNEELDDELELFAIIAAVSVLATAKGARL